MQLFKTLWVKKVLGLCKAFEQKATEIFLIDYSEHTIYLCMHSLYRYCLYYLRHVGSQSKPATRGISGLYTK
jgi:hypothetical protein